MWLKKRLIWIFRLRSQNFGGQTASELPIFMISLWRSWRTRKLYNKRKCLMDWDLLNSTCKISNSKWKWMDMLFTVKGPTMFHLICSIPELLILFTNPKTHLRSWWMMQSNQTSTCWGYGAEGNTNLTNCCNWQAGRELCSFMISCLAIAFTLQPSTS